MEDSESSASGSEDGSVEDSIQRELADIPLGELQELRQKVGSKKFDKALTNAVCRRGSEDEEDRPSTFKRANKRRPREMSSKKPVSRFREVIPVRRQHVRDPRFDEKTGAFNEDLFKKSYGFLEEMQCKEKKMVQRAARRSKDPARRQQLEKLLQKMASREAAQKRKEEQRALVREHRKKERELQQQGKKPFYIKKSTQKRIELAKKFKELRKTGKLEQFLSKRRRKNASRDRRHLPFKRTS